MNTGSLAESLSITGNLDGDELMLERYSIFRPSAAIGASMFMHR